MTPAQAAYRRSPKSVAHRAALSAATRGVPAPKRAQNWTPEQRAQIAAGMRGIKNALTASVKGECAYCGDPATTYDHVIPRGRPGSDRPDNLVPCCRSCNRSKGARTPEEWLAAGLFTRRTARWSKENAA